MSAIFSGCGKYRYVLRRKLRTPVRWVKPCLFIGMNPSIAGADEDDNSVRRMIGFAEREYCTDLTVCNLGALISTDQGILKTHPDPIGPENLRYLEFEIMAADQFGLVIAAFGSNDFTRKQQMVLKNIKANYQCLGKNQDGTPRHPLYLPKLTPLELWSPQ